MRNLALLAPVALLASQAGVHAAGGKLTATQITPTVQLAAKASWRSQCKAIAAPPWSVFVATTGGASVRVQRYLDSACTLPAGIAAPLPAVALVKSEDCPAGSFCGDEGNSGDQPAAAVRVTVTDTSGAPNWIVSAQLVADPPYWTNSPVREDAATDGVR